MKTQLVIMKKQFNRMRKTLALFPALLATIILLIGCEKSIDIPAKIEGPVFTKIENTGKMYLSEARYALAAAAAGNKIVFAGGFTSDHKPSKTVEIFDVVTNSWTITKLSEARAFLTGAAIGNKILFAGGTTRPGNYSKTVDIYDVQTGIWTTAQLGEASAGLQSAVVGNLLVFAGGGWGGHLSREMDTYNVVTGEWSYSIRSENRVAYGIAGLGNNLIFAGGLAITEPGYGDFLNSILIDNLSDFTSSTAQLSEPKREPFSITSGRKAIFAAGYDITYLSKTVDIYDSLVHSWSSAELTEARGGLAVASLGNEVIFAGGFTGVTEDNTNYIWTTYFSKTVDLYDAATGIWTIAQLVEARSRLAAAGAGNKILVAGGMTSEVQEGQNGTGSDKLVSTKTVDVFTLSR